MTLRLYVVASSAYNDSQSEESMAKAKKSGSGAGRSAAAKRIAPAKSPTAPAAAGAPLVDTNLAAQAAARMLVGKARHGAAAQPAAAKKESGSFKQLKESLNKPLATLSDAHTNLTQTPRGHSVLERINQPHHSQTRGGFNRTGVPRRTPG